jgi:hypothetical protein
MTQEMTVLLLQQNIHCKRLGSGDKCPVQSTISAAVQCCVRARPSASDVLNIEAKGLNSHHCPRSSWYSMNENGGLCREPSGEAAKAVPMCGQTRGQTLVRQVLDYSSYACT